MVSGSPADPTGIVLSTLVTLAPLCPGAFLPTAGLRGGEGEGGAPRAWVRWRAISLGLSVSLKLLIFENNLFPFT